MPARAYDFANILFSGACNAHCPFCIGEQIDPRLNQGNLNEFPPRGTERLVQLIREHKIRQVVFTGTNTDPLLYRHTSQLLVRLRRELPPNTRFSLHTNGRLALRKIALFNQFDRACISLPSFTPLTYQRMMGVPGVPDLAEVLRRARLPIKLSCLVTDDNAAEICTYLQRCSALGVRRVVLRKIYGEKRSWGVLLSPSPFPQSPSRFYRGNPVYDLQNLEVTLWDFKQAESTSINLFSSGVISTNYLLADSSTERYPPEPPAHPQRAWPPHAL